MFVISGIILIAFFVVFTVTLFDSLYPEHIAIVSEVALIASFSISLALKDFFIEKSKKKTNKDKRMFFMVRIREILLITRILRDILTIHLIIILIYKILPDQFHSTTMDKIIFPGLLFTFIFFVMVFDTIRVSIMKKKINSEDWLPIVNETGGVIGKVALSVSLTSQKSYLHPIVRIALIYKGLFYLCQRPEHYNINPEKIDYPFEKFVFYNHSLDEAIGNALEKETEKKDLPVKFVFRYLFSNSTINRLVYLYTCKINDEKTMNELNLTKGKLWTEKQIEENLGKGVFSECFEKEYEILKNTVLMAEKILKNNISSN
ncbi:hypothetical protein FACS1894155_01140 [Bacteroidia bacterium]|nr:hypothetical protein FACS189455_2450 [Bacteroidia bacterium]GHU87686.1 hypothetical protein FACS1894155_01140 [Bacteroidia bacterium]